MSQDWINRERLEESGLKSHEVDQVLEGLDENDGSVVRLYAGTSASGQTKFYEDPHLRSPWIVQVTNTSSTNKG